MYRLPLSRKMALVARFFFGLSILLLSANIATAEDKKDSKIDEGLLEADDLTPVFVRMTDNLIGKAGDFEKFCQEHQKQKRSEVRPFVIKTLQQKSEASWKKIAGIVKALKKDEQIEGIKRFWIVNGFACNATAEACKKLAESGDVSFIYKQANGVEAQMRAGQEPTDITDKQKEIYEQILKGWKDDSEEPFSAEGLDIPWDLKLIQADEVWKQEKVTGKGVVVALCDTGLMRTPALLQTLWKNPKEKLDGIDNDGNGYADDIFGYDFLANSGYVLDDDPKIPHGSMCAGIIAGRPINGKKLATGVAPRARIMMLRGSVADLKVYEYALTNGADIISMSQSIWNMEPNNFRGLYRTSQEHLVAAVVVVVGGSGNFSNLPKGKQIGVTKDIPCVITTAGVLKNGKKAPPSGMGPCYWENIKFYSDYPKTNPLMKPDVTGPFGGYPVWSRPQLANPKWEIFSKEGKDCALVVGPSGNSFAAPHTTGVAALMFSANPELNAWEVKQLMEQTCKDLGPKGRDTTYGAGLLQALAAVRAAKEVKK